MPSFDRDSARGRAAAEPAAGDPAAGDPVRVNPVRLGALAFFQGVLYPELVHLAKIAREADFAPGEAIVRQGDRGSSLFFVESGTADVVISGETVAEVGSGDVIGEIAVLAERRRTASVVATTPLRAVEIASADIAIIERGAPEATARLRRAMAEHIDRAVPPTA